ncbi:hypothetical protein BD413DRAFT_137189 [Trametes elegans]|nr:hypothetical protein BD413DRAFT_137189 [Trametes elegans]
MVPPFRLLDLGRFCAVGERTNERAGREGEREPGRNDSAYQKRPSARSWIREVPTALFYGRQRGLKCGHLERRQSRSGSPNAHFGQDRHPYSRIMLVSNSAAQYTRCATSPPAQPDLRSPLVRPNGLNVCTSRKTCSTASAADRSAIAQFRHRLARRMPASRPITAASRQYACSLSRNPQGSIGSGPSPSR